jgi:hypothetical protein
MLKAEGKQTSQAGELVDRVDRIERSDCLDPGSQRGGALSRMHGASDLIGAWESCHGSSILKQFRNTRSLLSAVQGGSSLMKKPLERVLSVYTIPKLL